jgi:hypothetical protein
MTLVPAFAILEGANQPRSDPLQKCPKCDQSLTYVTDDTINIGGSGMPSLAHPGMAYSCPHCSTILSVVDPRQLAALIAAEVARLLKGSRS